MRLIIAAVLGGFVMFVWVAIWQTLGIGHAGVNPVPNEAALSAALKANLTEPGMYFLPGFPATAEETAAWTARYKEGPTALLIYHPTGEDPMHARRLGVRLGSNIAAALVVGMILTFATVSWGRGVIISTLVGLAAWLSINVSYWNWYGFPTNFITIELIEQVVGWMLSGFVMGYILRRRV
jgi:hypothetical protein